MYIFVYRVLVSEDSSSVTFLFQGGDSRFDGRERVKYTREQLLELKEVSRIKAGLF